MIVKKSQITQNSMKIIIQIWQRRRKDLIVKDSYSSAITIKKVIAVGVLALCNDYRFITLTP